MVFFVFLTTTKVGATAADAFSFTFRKGGAQLKLVDYYLGQVEYCLMVIT